MSIKHTFILLLAINRMQLSASSSNDLDILTNDRLQLRTGSQVNIFSLKLLLLCSFPKGKVNGTKISPLWKALCVTKNNVYLVSNCYIVMQTLFRAIWLKVIHVIKFISLRFLFCFHYQQLRKLC